MSLLAPTDFPRWTRAKLGLPPNADLTLELEDHIAHAENHARFLVGDEAYDDLASDDPGNEDRRKRFKAAVKALTESRLYMLQAEDLGMRAGHSTQGARTRTITADARRGATAAANRAFVDFVEGMFRLGHVVGPRALNQFHVTVTR